MSVANSSRWKQNNHNVFWLLLETTASGVILEWAVGNDSESVQHIAVPHEPQIAYIRAPWHSGTEGGGSALMQTVHAGDMPYSAKGWKGLSLQIRGPFCAVPLCYIVPLQLT